jgi:hypothetical protein
MGRTGGYYLDKSPATTVGVCKVCGARCASLTTTGARHLILAHVHMAHGHP